MSSKKDKQAVQTMKQMVREANDIEARAIKKSMENIWNSRGVTDSFKTARWLIAHSEISQFSTVIQWR
jgi:hypothetical protein